jgi:flagellar basal-body rod protein FlgF
VVDRIKLVNPEPAGLRRGEDGLLQLRGGAAAEPDASVQIVSGVLENSNVNAVAALVNMIELSRSYEMQVKLMRDASENEMSSSQMMRMS